MRGKCQYRLSCWHCTGESFSYDDANTGYSGYAIKEYPGRSGILETLKSTDCIAQTTPDIVILQIGTNDVLDKHEIESSGERLSELVTYIMEQLPSDSALFVTSIPYLDPNRSDVYQWFNNYRHSDDWQTSYSDDVVEVNVKATVDSYNEIVSDTVSQLQGTYPNLYSGDVNSAITDVKEQLKDGVHPNNIGYSLMGAYWTDVIRNYLSGSSPSITTTTTTTITTTASITTSTTVSETSSTTTAIAPTKYKYKIADLVKLQQFILNNSSSIKSDDEINYDIDSNGRLNSLDTALLRKILISK